MFYGLMSGTSISDPAFLGKLLSKRLTILTSTLRNRPIEYKGKLAQAFSEDEDGLSAIASGEIKVTVDQTFLMEEVLLAHEMMSKDANTGKIVLMVSHSASAIDAFTKELAGITARNKDK